MGVSKIRSTPKSSILIGFSLINHPFWGTTIFGTTYILGIGTLRIQICPKNLGMGCFDHQSYDFSGEVWILRVRNLLKISPHCFESWYQLRTNGLI